MMKIKSVGSLVGAGALGRLVPALGSGLGRVTGTEAQHVVRFGFG